MDNNLRHFKDTTLMKELFLLDPDVIFLNHGSFGATPRPVFEEYQHWQEALERQPVQFLVHDLADHLAVARAALGNFIHADKDDLVYIPNATFGVNVVARSLALGDGDEVLTTNHEYGACNHVWQFLSRKRGFQYKQKKISLPVLSDDAFLEAVWQEVTSHTRVIFLSHITSSTACEFPVQAVCARAREAGILTMVDGAHTPGQISIDMEAIGADFYCGNAHKWLCSPKGAGFLWTRRDQQHLIEPLVVGWGWGEDRSYSYGSDYLDYMQWLGTNDLAAYLSIPAAIEFHAANEWTTVRQKCHKLLKEALHEVSELTNIPPSYPDSNYYFQMGVARLPQILDLGGLKDRLYDGFNIEIPCIQWQDQQFIRISIQGYNTREEVDCLIEALRKLIPLYRA